MKKRPKSPHKVALPLACTVALGVPGASVATAQAQGAAPMDAERMEKVIVTGSNIPTAETVAIPPVEIFTAETLEKSGGGNLEIISKKLPSAVGGGNFGMSRGNGGSGRSEIALRGIPGGTLLLINGRRTANQDLNAIPLGAIEQIEVLKDGGSSIYGADAVAGVVNIKLKRDFTGTEVDARYGNTTEEDSGEQRYSFITGMATEKTSVLVGGTYYQANSLYSGDRERSAPDITDPRNTSGTSNPGRVRTTLAPAGSDLLTGVVYRGAPGTTGTSPAQYSLFNAATDRFPYPYYTPAIRDAERYSIFGNGEHQLFGEQMKFFTEAFYTHSFSYNQLAPTPIVFQFNETPTSPTGIVIPATNPYNVFGVPINRMSYRPIELGPRTDSNAYDIIRFVSGLRGRIAQTTWNYEAAVLYTSQDGVNKQGNDISRAGLEAAVNSTNPATAFNPFGYAANSAAVIDSIRLDHYTFDLDQLLAFDAKVDGEVIDLPAGPLAVALGAEHRQERGWHRPDATLIYNDVVGFNGDKPYSGSRDVWSAFYELNIPVLGLDATIPGFYRFTINHSGRFENYSDFGDTYNPKVGFKWMPIDETLTLRASYSESFTAPTFGDLYATAQESYPELRNPVKFAAGDPTAFEQIRTFYSGNPNLEPTEAQNYTAGFVYSPRYVRGLTASVDFFRVSQENVPASVDQFIIDQNYATGGPGNPAAAYAANIDYDAATTTYRAVYAPTLNLSRRIVEGLDMSLIYERDTETAGKFTFSSYWSYFTRFEQEDLPGTGLRDRLGDFVDPSQSFGLGSLPRVKGNGSVFWNYRNLEVGFTVNYVGSYRDDAAAGFDREVDEWITYDAQVSYQLPWDIRATIGVLNLTDEAPPLVRAAFADNYDRDTHDLRGRFVYASLN